MYRLGTPRKIPGKIPGRIPPFQCATVVKVYGQAAAWAALVMDGEEIIPAGRSNWLQFVWLSHNKEQQRRVYEFIKEDSAREEAIALPI